MPTYCFICDECGARWSSDTRHQTWDECRDCGAVSQVRRDYKAENVGINIANLKAAH